MTWVTSKDRSERPEQIGSFEGQWGGDVYLCELCPGYGAAVYGNNPDGIVVQAFIRHKGEPLDHDFVDCILRSGRPFDSATAKEKEPRADLLPDYLTVIAVMHEFAKKLSQQESGL